MNAAAAFIAALALWVSHIPDAFYFHQAGLVIAGYMIAAAIFLTLER
jgi:hypothetical protein